MYTSTSTHAMSADILANSDMKSILHTYINKYNKLRLSRQMKLFEGAVTGNDQKRSIPHGGPDPIVYYGIRVRFQNLWIGSVWVRYSMLYRYAIEVRNAWAVAASARRVSNCDNDILIASDDLTSCAYYWDAKGTRIIFIELLEDEKTLKWRSMKLQQ